MWLASWMDYSNTESENTFGLADTAGLKQERDQAKYDKASKNLSSEIDKRQRHKIVKNMKNKDPKNKKDRNCVLPDL